MNNKATTTDRCRGWQRRHSKVVRYSDCERRAVKERGEYDVDFFGNDVVVLCVNLCFCLIKKSILNEIMTWKNVID